MATLTSNLFVEENFRVLGAKFTDLGPPCFEDVGVAVYCQSLAAGVLLEYQEVVARARDAELEGVGLLGFGVISDVGESDLEFICLARLGLDLGDEDEFTGKRCWGLAHGCRG